MQIPKPPNLRRYAMALGVACVAALSVYAWAQTKAPPPTGEAAAVKKLVEQRFPGAEILSVTKSPYFGLYEVQFDGQLIYTDPKVTYVVVGAIYEAATKTNLTEERLRKLNRVAIDELPLNLALKKVKGNGQRKLAVFSDPDCPFCAKLEQELKSIDNVTIYTFLFPIDGLHPDAARKSRLIWCAPDRVKAWDDFFQSGTVPKNDGNCDNPIAATNALGQQMGVSATPTLVFADGSVVAGALPAQRLEAEIKQGEAEAARLAAAKK